MKIQRHHLLPRFLLLTVLAVWPAVLILGQEPAKAQPARVEKNRKAISYVFVSPNTRENLTIKEAIAGLSSFDENLDRTDRIDTRTERGDRL